MLTKPKPATGAAAAEKVAALKSQIYALTKNKDNGLKNTEAETQQILDLATQLGKLNQVRLMGIQAHLISRIWQLVYAICLYYI